jgi:hypothetical protein
MEGSQRGSFDFIFCLQTYSHATASRMESHGMAGKIQISQATYELIQHEFDCRYRGPVELKGRGRVEAWFVEVHANTTINNQQSSSCVFGYPRTISPQSSSRRRKSEI